MLNILISLLLLPAFMMTFELTLGHVERGVGVDWSDNFGLKLTQNVSSKIFRTKRTPSSSSTSSHVSFRSNYRAQGYMWKLDNLDIYETKDKRPKKLLIAVYDIFGYHNNTFRTADKLAAISGFRVVMPDYFRQKGFPNTEELNENDVHKFVQAHGDWTKVKADTLKVIDHYRTREGIQIFGIYGHCWGGNIAVMAGGQLNDIQVVGSFHPFGLPKEDVEKVKVPTILMPSKTDPDLTDHYKILQQKFGPHRCGHRRFTDMVHGFTSARASDGDTLTMRRIDEAVILMSKFVNDIIFLKIPPQYYRKMNDRLVKNS